MFLPVVIHLLESGASIAMQDTNGKTPIDVAINPQISFRTELASPLLDAICRGEFPARSVVRRAL